MKSLYEALQENRDAGICPMHMPGHKRNTHLFQMENPYGLDITEIHGFDNLHNAQGILKESMERAAALWGARQTWFLINGSSCGVLAGIAACTQWGDEVLVSRNSHKSLYHALYQNNLFPHYLCPETIPGFEAAGGITPQSVEEALRKHPNVKLVAITSPTYEGVLSDVKAIADIVHAKGIPLFVDEAHGAHLGLAPGFPKSAIQCGADLVVQSLHKTLPSLTQTAVLHLNNHLVQAGAVERQLSIYETSSPSYLLLASMDRCVQFLWDHGREAFSLYREKLEQFEREMRNLSYFCLLGRGAKECSGRYGIYALDPSKIVLGSFGTNLTGPQIMESLRRTDKIELEMAASFYVIAMTSLCDTKENFQRLAHAFLRLEKEESLKADRIGREKKKYDKDITFTLPVKVMSLREAESKAGKCIPFFQSEGYICRETIFAYPPGIPLIVPGEQIDKKLLERICFMQEAGISLNNSRRSFDQQIDVVWE